MRKQISTSLYITTLVITAIIFVVALFTSNYLTQKKTDELKEAEAKITVDILSLETQFELLNDASCSSSATSTMSTLAVELDNLNNRLIFMEGQVGVEDPEVFRLKRYHSILQIKDYLLRKKMAEQCKTTEVFVLYFYDKIDCDECTRQEYMLKAVREQYSNVRIYSFDYKLDLPAVTTLISLHEIPNTAPVLDIQGKPYAAFDTYEDMKLIIDKEIAKLSTTTATSTKKTTSTSR